MGELCDRHLLVEHRELRIPNAVACGKYSLIGQPQDYIGVGHVRFFFNKLLFLKKRYELLHAECLARGFKVQNFWTHDLPSNPELWLNYVPTSQALAINRERLALRKPQKPRFTPHIFTSR